MGRPGPCCLYCSLGDFHIRGGRAVKERPQTDLVEIRLCAIHRSELSAAIPLTVICYSLEMNK